MNNNVQNVQSVKTFINFFAQKKDIENEDEEIETKQKIRKPESNSDMFRATRHLNKDEVQKIEEYFSEKCESCKNAQNFSRRELLCFRDRVYMSLALKCGFRVSEILSLRVKQVYNGETGEFYGTVLVERENMKGKKRGRACPLAESTKRYLTDLLRFWETIYKRPLAENDFLIQGIHHQNLKMSRNNMNCVINRLCRDLDIDDTNVGTHSMRKTCAQSVYEKSNKDIVCVAKFLGHRDTKTTLNYLSGKNAEIRELFND